MILHADLLLSQLQSMSQLVAEELNTMPPSLSVAFAMGHTVPFQKHLSY